MAFGQFIKDGRKMRDMSQTEVAQMVGITQAYYSIIEKGAIDRNIDLVLALKICQVLNLDMSNFIHNYM